MYRCVVSKMVRLAEEARLLARLLRRQEVPSMVRERVRLLRRLDRLLDAAVARLSLGERQVPD